jgi:ATP-dependent DNA helicase RecG
MAITKANIVAWASQGESQTFELKATTSSGCRAAAAKTLCAFLNTRGGRVLFGVEPDGEVKGQTVSDKTLRDVAATFSEIEPPVFPAVEAVAVGGGRSVVVASVEKGHNRPYTFKGKSYRRVGSSTVEMDQAAYNEMLLEQLHGTTRWENEPATGWGIEDLDQDEILATVEDGIRSGRIADPATRDPSELLRGLGLVKSSHLLRAAVVLFARGDRLLPDFPQCQVRLAKFKGIDKTEFIDNRHLEGNAFQLLRISTEFLRQHLPIAGKIVPNLFERQDDPIYPPEALREALANAFCHRDYSAGGGAVDVAIYDDRLEISSSGELHFGLTVDDLYEAHTSQRWNPAIASVFFKRGIIESWGRGTIKMAELTQQAGLPRPEFEEMPGTLVVRFRPSSYLPPQRIGRDLTDQQRQILAVLAARGELRLGRIEELLEGEISRSTLQSDLQFLRSLDLVDAYGWGRGARWTLKQSQPEI